MGKYKFVNSIYGGTACILKLNDDGDEYTTAIPLDENNTDYQEYLAWVAEGNTADPADE